MAKWIKSTPYGDYKDPLQNHKFDGDLHFRDENSMIVTVRTKRHELLHQCRTLGTHGKHIGSKTYKQLIGPLRRVNKARAAYNKMLKALENNNKQDNVSENTDK